MVDNLLPIKNLLVGVWLTIIIIGGLLMRTVKHPHKRNRLEEYLQGLIDKTYTLKQVSELTGYTVPHLCNLKKAYRDKGKSVLINGHKGKPPMNKIPDKIKENIVAIYQEGKTRVNFKFFVKILHDTYNITYSYKTIYKILTAANITSPKTKNRPKNEVIHPPRERREQGGELVQLDATPYPWFLWCGDTYYYSLHACIDDAEEKLTGLSMQLNECSYGYYDVLLQTAHNFGLPLSTFTDRAIFFCLSPRDKDNLTIQEQLAGLHEKHTQWQRILGELEINQILAFTPQAKGRVERLWKTLQGRLPWYFEHYEIKTIEDANDFLQNEYIKIFNDEFAIKREKPAIWRKPPENLDLIICSRFKRRVNSAGVISFQGYKFLVEAPHCAKTDIELCIFKDGLKALVKDKYYPVKLLDDLTYGVSESMSDSLKDIISRYMYSDCKKVSC